MKPSTLAAAFLFAAAPANADSHADPAAGEAGFRQCQSCHVVADAEGTVLAGKKGETGPNLFGVIGRQAGTLEGFEYKEAIVAAGEAGLVWTEETIAEYLQDPTAFLRAFLDDPSMRSGMSFRLRKPEDAANMAAFLATFTAG